MSGSFTYGFPHRMPNLNEMNGLRFGIAFAPILSGGIVLGPRLIEAGKYVMKAELSGWPIVSAIVLALLFCGAEQARATSITIVDFEDQGVGVGAYHTTANGVGVISRGFHYTPGPIIDNPSKSDDLHIVNQAASFLSPYNGTTVGLTHDDVILTKVGEGAFSLERFDFAGALTNKEVSFTVTGLREDDSTITQYFTPDGEVDGNVWGGVDDFETFSLVGDWTNLKRVTWTHKGPGTDDGRFAIDNIVVNKYSTVPEPSTIILLGLGILCLPGQGWLARRRLKALAEVA